MSTLFSDYLLTYVSYLIFYPYTYCIAQTHILSFSTLCAHIELGVHQSNLMQEIYRLDTE
jgi:hypothetical protein